MLMDHYAVIVIGGGGGGYPAAFRLAASGKTVLMIDHHGTMGGNCLYDGCVPSKAVREASIMQHQIAGAQFFGVSASLQPTQWSAIRAYKDQVQSARYTQHAETIRSTAGITVLRGEGQLVDAHRVKVIYQEDGSPREQTVTGQDLVIATGSITESAPITGLEHAWTSHDLFAWQDAITALPHDIVILGGGYIGVEAASMLSDLGVQVTLIEREHTLLSSMDQEIVSMLTERLAQRVKIVLDTSVDTIVPQDGRFVVQGRGPSGAPVTWTTDRVLAALGRIPCLPPALGLDHAGVESTPQGIIVNGRMQTNVPHVYAPGDVNGQSMLLHAAERMSHMVAQMISAGSTAEPFRPEEMPLTVFSRPATMSVGLTMAVARQQGLAVYEEQRAMQAEDWALIRGEPEGFYKFVVSKATGRIVGAHAIGIDAVALSSVSHMIVRLGLTPQDVSVMAFPHPTQFEIVNALAWNNT